MIMDSRGMSAGPGRVWVPRALWHEHEHMPAQAAASDDSSSSRARDTSPLQGARAIFESRAVKKPASSGRSGQHTHGFIKDVQIEC